jgi:hypothetical protein
MTALYAGLLCLLFAKWIRINFVMSSGSFSWTSIRCLFLNMCSVVSNAIGVGGLYRFFNDQKQFKHAYQYEAVLRLIGITNAAILIWLILAFLINLRKTEELRFLRSRVIEQANVAHPHTKEVKAKEVKKKTSAGQAAGEESPTDSFKERKEVSLKELVAKQMAGRETPRGKAVEAHTSHESLGNDYYNMMTAKGKVTSISQYFSGIPKADKEGVTANTGKAKAPKAKAVSTPITETGLKGMVEAMSTKTVKKSQSAASVGSTGSDYYAAMIKEGKIPKIGSISQYGALLK